MGFKIVAQPLGDAVSVIRMQGDVDVHTAPHLKHQLLLYIEDGVKLLVVDLSKVTYVDSTALGVLIGGLKKIREADGDMVVVCAAPRIRRVFEVTGLDRIFDIYDSEPELLETIGKGS